MTTVNRTTLKTYFQTGNQPTQTQFDNLIDISGGYNAIKKTNLNENCYRSGLIISN